MDQKTLTDAARTVLLTIGPLLAGGALAKPGEEMADPAKEALARAWDAVEARFQRKLTDAERAELRETAAVVDARLAGTAEASAALALLRTNPQNETYRQIVVAQIVEVFRPAPDELIALARASAAIQPAPPPHQGASDATADGHGQLGNLDQGGTNGNLGLGPRDYGHNRRIASPVPGNPDTRSSEGAPGPDTLVTTRDSSRVTGRSSLPSTLSADGVHFTFGHALVIGAGMYQDARLNVAGGTTINDARALGNLLRDPRLAAYPREQVRVLVDAKATRNNILDALSELAYRSTDGTALIVFAGHGELLDDGYALLPYDVDLRNLAGTTITAELLHRRVAKIRERARRLIVILNCCCAGGAGDAGMGGGEPDLSGSAPPPEFYRPLAVDSGQVVISASRPGQTSGTRAARSPQHTTFGAHLLDALRGKAPGAGPGVGVFELFAHLRATVPADARSISYRGRALTQEPLFYASQRDDNISVALRPAEIRGATRGPDQSERVARLVELELQIESLSNPAPPDLLAERDHLLRGL